MKIPAIRAHSNGLIIRMSSILIIGVVIVVIVLFVLGRLAKAKAGGDSTPAGAGSHYELRSPFFSAAERSFLGVLESALPEGIDLWRRCGWATSSRPRKD